MQNCERTRESNGAAMSFSSQPREDYNGPPSPRRVSHARGSSQQHVPTTPSRLRETVARSPEEQMTPSPSHDWASDTERSPLSSSTLHPERSEPLTKQSHFHNEEGEEGEDQVQGSIVEPTQKETNARTRLLEDYHRGAACGSRNCDHGTFSPRLGSSQNSISSGLDFGGRFGGDIGEDGGDSDGRRGILGDTFVGGLFGKGRRDKKMSTTQWLASKHGVTNQRTM